MAAAVPMVWGAAGHVSQGVRADEVPARTVGPGAAGPLLTSHIPTTGLRSPEPDCRTVHSHNVIGLQPCVRWGVDEDIGEGVLLVIHFICNGHSHPGSPPGHVHRAAAGRGAGAEKSPRSSPSPGSSGGESQLGGPEQRQYTHLQEPHTCWDTPACTDTTVLHTCTQPAQCAYIPQPP